MDTPAETQAAYGLPLPFSARIVGGRFTPGGEQCYRLTLDTPVMLKRNPANKFDSNAIEVHAALWDDDEQTVRSAPQMMGHIGREYAAELAPVMDSLGLTVCPATVALAGEPVIYVAEFPAPDEAALATCFPEGSPL